MDGPSQKGAGILVFVGVVQYGFFLLLSEILYPGYSVSLNTISDLGATCSAGTCIFVQPSSTIFDSSIVLLGILLFFASYYFWKAFGSKAYTLFTILAGVGCLGVGILNESFGSIHALVSGLTFISIGILAILTVRVAKPPISYFSAVAGVVSLVASALYINRVYLGLGQGGMERMVVYPVLLASIGVAGYFIAAGERELP